jgi:hypothetical protein
MLAVVVLLAALDALVIEYVFVSSLLGLLVLSHLASWTTATPRWQTRLRWLLYLGVLLFAYVALYRVFSP